jgi:hypothetical protein
MRILKSFRNAVGTVGMLFTGYIIIVSLKDARRYVKITLM